MIKPGIRKANPKRGWHNVTKWSTVDGDRHNHQLLPGSDYNTKVITRMGEDFSNSNETQNTKAKAPTANNHVSLDHDVPMFQITI